MTNSQATLSIGEVAAACGVTVPTLRFYDELGLVPPTERVGGARRYTMATLHRVRFVRNAQRFGFSLEEIQAMLERAPTAWALAADKLDELRVQQSELAELIGELEGVQRCRCAAVETCDAQVAS